MTEAEALKRFIPILGRISPPSERATITRNILERIDGQQTCIMGISHKQAGALAWPNDQAKATAFESALDMAVDTGDFVSLLHRVDRRHFQIEELCAWPNCPAIALDSPLTFWLGEPAPAQSPATPAPVVAALVELDKAGPVPVTTRAMADSFAGLHWDGEQWIKKLGDKPVWLDACMVLNRGRGEGPRLWNPVLIGSYLVRMEHVKAKSVRAKFQTQPALKPWLDEWKTYEADNHPTD